MAKNKQNFTILNKEIFSTTCILTSLGCFTVLGVTFIASKADNPIGLSLQLPQNIKMEVKNYK